MCADRDAIIEVDDVLVEQTNAAARDGLADGLGLSGAVQAEERVVAVAVQIERTGAEWVVGAAINSACIRPVAAASRPSCGPLDVQCGHFSLRPMTALPRKFVPSVRPTPTA